MKIKDLSSVKKAVRCLSAALLSLAFLVGQPAGVRADEEDAKRLLKNMADFMAAQKVFSFEFDATLEVVTVDEQKLALASSGAVTLSRPNKIHATRFGGFTGIEMLYDGKTLTLLGKALNIYTQIEIPGTIDDLIDESDNSYKRPMPGADLLLANAYKALMHDVVDIKDLGSGVIGGIECDYLAFRTKDVDYQIWIAQGEHPYPYRYVITSKLINGEPQYILQTRNWKTGDEVVLTDFSFKNPTKAAKVELKDLKGTEDLPDHFTKGETK
jgi:hypothetical protein